MALQVLGKLGDAVRRCAERDDNQARITTILEQLMDDDGPISLTDSDLGSLGHTGVQQVVAVLRERESLRGLQLDRNGIGDDVAESFAEVLRANSALQSLDLDFNKIGDDGVSSLAEALQASASLRELSLNCNLICAEGAKQLATALRANEGLQALHLQGNSIADEGAGALAGMLEVNHSLKTLSLESSCVGDDGASLLANSLERNKSLQELSLGCNNLGDEAGKAFGGMLCKNRVLSELRLDHNHVGNVGAMSLAKALCSNDVLQELWLVENPIGTEGMAYFATSLETNQTIQRFGITASKTDVQYQKLMKSLHKTLVVRRACDSVRRGDANLKLSGEDLSGNAVELLASAIEESDALRELTLEDCCIADPDAKRLARALSCNGQVAEVALPRNDIGDVGASHLVEVLQRSDTMVTLDLAGNPIRKTCVNKLRSASQGDDDPIGDEINGDVAMLAEFEADASDSGYEDLSVQPVLLQDAQERYPDADETPSLWHALEPAQMEFIAATEREFTVRSTTPMEEDDVVAQLRPQMRDLGRSGRGLIVTL